MLHHRKGEEMMKKRCLSLGVALGVALAAMMCGFPVRSEAVVRMKLA
jgi:hypothetical protein